MTLGNLCAVSGVILWAVGSAVWGNWRTSEAQASSEALAILREQLARCGPEHLHGRVCPPCDPVVPLYDRLVCFFAGVALVGSFWLVERVRNYLASDFDEGTVLLALPDRARPLTDGDRWRAGGGQAPRRLR